MKKIDKIVPAYVQRRLDAEAAKQARQGAVLKKRKRIRQIEMVADRVGYQPPDPDIWKTRVERALLKYKMGGDGGFDILRYTKQGRVEFDPVIFGTLMQDWYPRNPDYIILRMAKMGKLSYKMTDEEKLAQLEKTG